MTRSLKIRAYSGTRRGRETGVLEANDIGKKVFCLLQCLPLNGITVN